jgi:type IV secretion system protein VirB9
MTIVRFLLGFLLIFISLSSFASPPILEDCKIDNSCINDIEMSLTTDNRIKTYLYNPNEVYLLVVHYGFQSLIQFDKNEKIQTVSFGDSFAWKIDVIDNILIIKPKEKNLRSNMVVFTNKNKIYQFDIVAKELEPGQEKELVYTIRFKYPAKKKNKNI